VINDLAAGKKPHFKADDERVYYTFAMEILESHVVSDATFNEARKIFGERALVDLIGSVGYFSMLQICLNSAEVDLQADRKPPFANMKGYKKTS
jgi:4-carboxymuconolactone decarboxylase